MFCLSCSNTEKQAVWHVIAVVDRVVALICLAQWLSARATASQSTSFHSLGVVVVVAVAGVEPDRVHATDNHVDNREPGRRVPVAVSNRAVRVRHTNPGGHPTKHSQIVVLVAITIDDDHRPPPLVASGSDHMTTSSHRDLREEVDIVTTTTTTETTRHRHLPHLDLVPVRAPDQTNHPLVRNRNHVATAPDVGIVGTAIRRSSSSSNRTQRSVVGGI